jgi:hypothetical protein
MRFPFVVSLSNHPSAELGFDNEKTLAATE